MKNETKHLKLAQIVRILLDRKEPTSEQLSWINQYWSSERIVELAGDRNSGRTLIGSSLVITDAIANPRTYHIVVSKNIDQAFSLCKFMNGLLTHRMKSFISRINRQEIQLYNGSMILFKSLSPYSFRGISAKNVFLDLSVKSLSEINHEVMASVVPCIAHSGGKLVVSLENP